MGQNIEVTNIKKLNQDVILIVDDEDSEIYLCESIFNYMYESDTKDVLVLACYTSDEVEKIIDSKIYIDLVLMDINLSSSSLTGIELVRYIRKSNGLLPPPVVGMLTTSSRDRDLRDSIEANVDFYLEKTEDIYWFEACLKAVKNFYLDKDDYLNKDTITKYFSYLK